MLIKDHPQNEYKLTASQRKAVDDLFGNRKHLLALARGALRKRRAIKSPTNKWNYGVAVEDLVDIHYNKPGTSAKTSLYLFDLVYVACDDAVSRKTF